jgi:CheY-like chemotaxis protein
MASVELTVTTVALLRAIGLLAVEFPEKFHPVAWRAITSEYAQREIGYSARPLRLAQHAYDALPGDVKAILQGAARSQHKMNGPVSELRGIHVLVIDDDQFARRFLRSVLELSGAIVTATNAVDAIRVALIADVIVCDLASAEAADAGFLERLRHMHVRQGRRVPAIALVARGVTDAGVRAPGFQRYLAKPVDGDELRAAALEQFRSQTPPDPGPGVEPG